MDIYFANPFGGFQMSQDSFPVVIFRKSDELPSFIKKPEELPVGIPFKILLTKATPAQFQIAEQVCERLLRVVES